jgi:hypothetical protein
MDQVTQRNATCAEQSAAAAKEMKSQATILTNAVHQLNGLVGTHDRHQQHAGTQGCNRNWWATKNDL